MKCSARGKPGIGDYTETGKEGMGKARGKERKGCEKRETKKALVVARCELLRSRGRHRTAC